MKTVYPLITLLSAALVAGKPVSLGNSGSLAVRDVAGVQIPSNVLSSRNQPADAKVDGMYFHHRSIFFRSIG